jgi:long-chain fatty acid transport protein
MNLEGYGPIATGMGGASMAYDNGTAAMMNNPATLALMPEGNRFDVALGYLGIDITTTAGLMGSDSTATAFYMPAIGWVTKTGQTTYGIGMFAQGGMGTQYEADSFLTAGSNELVRSEVSVGRVLVPFVYDVTPAFKIGGTVDFVWAGMDIKMALDGNTFLGMATGTSIFGSASGTMVNTLAGAIPTAITSVNWARFDFSNTNDYTGEAMGTGYAGKIGAVFKATDDLSFGLAYHSKTALGNLDADNAKLSMNVTGPGVPGGTATIAVTGKIEVKDFEWPQMVGLGTSYKATNKLTLAVDYKWINWKDVMKDFKMSFVADAVQADPLAAGFGLGSQGVDATLFQNWKDQNVFMLGASYAMTDAFTLRAGLNLANNPIPDTYMNALFPAIIENHYTLGAGYAFTKQSTADISMSIAPEVESTNAAGITVKHSQTNAQVMYSYRF